MTYRQALDETLKAIDEGAYPLHLDTETYILLRGRYEKDFEEVFDEKKWIGESNQEGQRVDILKRARLVGSLATALTAAYCETDMQSDLSVVKREYADVAGYAVSKLSPDCKPGKYCYRYTLDGYGDRQSRVSLTASMLIKTVSTAIETLKTNP